MDCIFSASQIIEKHREFNIPTFVAFIDFKKSLWSEINYGIPTYLITTIQKIYMENIIKINAGNGISEDSRAIYSRGDTRMPTFTCFIQFIVEVIRIWSQKLKTSKYFKELIFNKLVFADDQFIISDTEDNLQKAVCLLYNISKEYNLEIATKKTKVFGFVGTDHIRTKLL